MKKINTFYIASAILIFSLFSCRKENSIDEQVLTPGSPGTWVQKNDFPASERTAAMSFVVNNKAYVFGGTTNDNSTFFKDVWQYSPANDSWIKKNDMPVERGFGVSFVINGKGYVGTGANSNGILDDFWEYNPVNDAWTQKAGLNFTAVNAIGFAINGKGYIIDGTKKLIEYNPGNDIWAEKKEVPFDDETGSEGAAAFVYGNKAYIVAGRNITATKSLWEYNPVNDSWLTKQSLPESKERFWTDCFVLKNRIFITGGGVSVDNTFTMLSDVLEYDIKNNKWIEQTSLPDGKNRMDHCSFVVDNKAYITTGVHDLNVNPTINFKDVWEFKL